MQMRVLSTSTMAEDADNHKNNAHEVVSIRTMQMRVLSTRTMQMRLLSTTTMPNEVATHNNNANEVAK